MKLKSWQLGLLIFGIGLIGTLAIVSRSERHGGKMVEARTATVTATVVNGGAHD